MRITDKETKYIAYGLLIFLLWFSVIKEAIAPMLQNMPIPIATFIYNFGVLAGLYFITKPLNGNTAFKLSIAGYSIFVGIDLLQAPFLVTKAGEYITTADFWFVSTDVAVAEMFRMFGVAAQNLYFYTYVVGAVLLILVIPALMANEKRILKMVR
jgi:hypothetical protein